MKKFNQVLLVIFDGWGIGPDYPGNAITKANKPFFDHLWSDYPHSLIQASGAAVGLPDGEMGNSEVGHSIIGAGNIIDSDFVRITKAFTQGQVLENPSIKQVFDHVKQNNSVLHLNGLISPGGVHSHQDHVFALLRAAKEYGVPKVVIHAFTDGRDTPPKSAYLYLRELEKVIDEVGIGFIASVTGRYYAMDRDSNWDRTQKAWDAIFEAKGKQCYLKKPSEIVQHMYTENSIDEQMEPLVFCDESGNSTPLNKNDGVLFFNFRADRARQLSKKFEEKSNTDQICFVTMTEYDKNLQCLVAFPPQEIKTTLAEQISKAGLSQTHIGETEKYAHVTYFLNGGREEPYPNENRILVESRKDVRTHDLAPEMKALEIAQKTAEELEKGRAFVVLNFANPDMVGHTGNMDAAVKAIESVDQALKIVVEKVIEKGGVALITSDHGNAEKMLNEETGQPHTAHTSNPVPGIITSNELKIQDGGLSDIAPTVLELLGLEKPAEMSGHSLISESSNS